MRRRSRGRGWHGRRDWGGFRLWRDGERFRRGRWRRDRRRWLLPVRRGSSHRSRDPGNSRCSTDPHRTNGRSGDNGPASRGYAGTSLLVSWFGGDDFAVFPREQGEVPAFVFGAELLGHGFGGGLAAGDECGLLIGETNGFVWFHWRRKSFIC